MKRKLTLLAALCLLSTSLAFSQEASQREILNVIKAEKNLVVVEIDLNNWGAQIPNKIANSEVNSKSGFSVYLKNDRTATLSFSENFTDQELQTLLEYSGIRLDVETFERLNKLTSK